MNSRIIVGGHLGLGRDQANSEHTRLLTALVGFQHVEFCRDKLIMIF